ncbi:glycosyltransferase family 39 protein [Pontibacter beigongshangensis]|uniref:glycosyltransferase family 39 protein n=1 Tax=Pontibacter beigongshangensis TaxID=2574733 RepID=UPI00164F9442|nr:glycosyltransferase family 39 protein [Pontibacter beigongshangensis]
MISTFRTLPYKAGNRVFPLEPAPASRSYSYTGILLLLLAIGTLLRLFHFFDNRSLWTDELFLSISLIKMSFWELATLPLAYEQKAPIGYLWMVRLCVVLFGNGEMALRLFSLLCGVASLFFFIPVARHFLRPWAVALALGMLALSTPVIYHSVEAKQYSTELLAAILALYFYTRYSQRQVGVAGLVVWGVLGGALLLFSYSVIFVLAGIAFALILHILLKKEWKKLFLYLVPFSMWLLCFGLTYIFFIGKYEDSGWLMDFFDKVYDAFMPVAPTSVSELVWFGRTAYLALHHPLGLLLNFNHSSYDYSNLESLLRLPVLPFLLGVTGVVFLLRQQKLHFAVLVFPVVLALLASGLKQYPFCERFLLFLVPSFVLTIALGVEQAYKFSSGRAWVFGLLAFMLLAPPAWNVARDVVNPNLFYKKSYNREAMLQINDQFQEGDVVYLYWNATPAYQYYKEAYHLKFEAIEGKDLKSMAVDKEEYVAKLSPEFKNFEGKKRLWFVYSKSLRNNIGDFVSQPAWYHEREFIPGKMLEDLFSGYGKKYDRSVSSKGLVTTLFELKEN